MSDLVKRLRTDNEGCGTRMEKAADAIERKDAAIAELTEALKRDVVDETRNAELNNAKDAAIAELVHSGRAIIARWHSPFWKDAKHTGEYIAELQAVCDKYDK